MKVLLTDDHAVVRQGYASLLSTMLDGCEMMEASSGWECLTLWQQHRPDVLVLDINLTDISGIETARRILQRDREARILFFSMYDELPMVQQALDAGALGYITKSSSPEVLLEAVRKVMMGQPYVEHELATRLAMQRNTGMDPRLEGMTQREFEIFVMLARGLTPKAIAEQLCISAKTVSNHSTLLKNKLQVSSTAELVHLAIQCGLLKLGISE
ncbi:response regulator transcription factor [Marinobacterium sediminicola]|uniref:Two component transcriptional regulator, LuxR family n=1 Tax=Marinobacterium sediminicola TaxID=518898 RepID=A0ABY1RXG7_9GAMM|nr:response regulator transcription factor [Marinobacterium sediminicola]ULG67749.1 response regulator transcription factor [Marinobacterium sediminicola]SMR71605.1 two component transcriptional regulator, LuxR family [Marinobacterium sediminicola]